MSSGSSGRGLLLAFLLGSAALAAAQQTFWSDQDPETIARRLISEMSEEEILGQVFLVGFPSAVPSPEILAWIERRNLGGVKIFGWNTDSLPVLASSVGRLQKAAGKSRHGIPLFIATDQEGGWVRHVKGWTSITPGNMAIGATGLPIDAYKTGYYIGQELRALGINMNFAPTVDVYTNPAAHVIGPRAFSSDPVQTGNLALAYYRGMLKSGIICTAKHYPGHGNAEGDSHGMLPRINDSFETLWERDLAPYRMLIADGLPAVLSGHLSFPAITKDGLPASLSRFFATEVLRGRLNFKGLLITDDLYMTGALGNGYSLAEICVRALEAGNDLIMLSRTPGLDDAVWQALQRRYRSDERFRLQIKASVARILVYKARLLKGPAAVPLVPESGASNAMPSEESRAFFFDQACRSVTLIKGASIIPYRPAAGEKVLLAGQHKGFFSAGRERYPGADEFSFPFSPFYTALPEDKARFKSLADKYDTIIFCMSNPNSLEVLEAASQTKARVIVISILTPVYLEQTPWIEAALAVYGWGNESFRAGFAALRGDFAAGGALPFPLNGRQP